MSRQAPTAVLQAALRSFETAQEVKKELDAAAAPFIPSASFVGSRPGYYFTSGEQGVGYYADPRQPKQNVLEDKQESLKPQAAEPVDANELLREAEKQAGDDGAQQLQLLDAKGLKRLVLVFERKYKENMEMRMKHSDAPEKFMDSEVDLDESVRSLQAIAGSPELYPELIRMNTVPSLLQLLSHENTDIAAGVIDLFRELTDSDVVEDSEEEARALVDHLIESNAVELLVHRLGMLSEGIPEEATAVFNALSIFENMVEVQPSVAETLLERSRLLKWILNRLKVREFDSNKQYVSELLAILLQNSRANQKRLTDANGIDIILQALAPFRGRDPQTTDEEEYIENLFDALCSCLMNELNKTKFVGDEGVELMVLIMKGKRFARAGACKTLDFALTRCPAACEHFVDTLGLKSLFGIFMGKSKMKRHKDEDTNEAEEEERAVSIISNLFQGLARGSRRDRVAAKFVENEFEKCDRLMELFVRYQKRVAAEEARILSMENDEDVDDEYVLLARMDAGLYTLQQCATIIGHLWFVGDLGVRKRILMLLHQQSMTLAGVRAVLVEFHHNIGVEGGEEEQARQRDKVRKMILAMGGAEQELEKEEPQPTQQEMDAAVMAELVDGAVGNGHAPEGEADVDMDMEDDMAGARPPADAPPDNGRSEADADRQEKASSLSKEEEGEAGRRQPSADDADRHLEARHRDRKEHGDRKERKERKDKDRHRDKDKDKERHKERDGKRKERDADKERRKEKRHRDHGDERDERKRDRR
ncbi:hypothetical protein WJX72_000948 [[Myrmecia] bisecta]|uniref:Beta-catenin-like protein 1 N-terminal domain-containing protein n=1 Tax=[Myrmecia] bisecta TaxID=41462 RepID=A0AAW1QE46_9CHLO